MKLESKHLAPYLPYGCNCYLQGHIDEENKPIKEKILGIYDKTDVYVTLNVKDNDTYDIIDVCPILRPLSDLTKEIEHNGKKFNPIKLIRKENFEANLFSDNGFIYHSSDLPYCAFVKLLEWHFDIFGLIDSGLAIDINTLNK